MRRDLMCAVMLILVALMAPGVAYAKPTVKVKAEAVPIPGFPHTGDILGAGTAAHGEVTIEGNEYFGSPPPIIGVNVYLPLGVQLHPNGFPICDASTIENLGPSACPKGSAAGPVGNAIGFVTLGGERVEETAELFTFYGPGGGGYVFADGRTPVSLEILSTERLVKPGDSGGSGPEMSFNVPLVASLPGAPYASIRSIDFRRAPPTAPTATPSTTPGFPTHARGAAGRRTRKPSSPKAENHRGRRRSKSARRCPARSEAAAAHRSRGARR